MNKINLFPVGLPPDPKGGLCDAMAQKFAQFAHDHKRDYDTAAHQAAIEAMKLFQEFLDEVCHDGPKASSLPDSSMACQCTECSWIGDISETEGTADDSSANCPQCFKLGYHNPVVIKPLYEIPPK